MCPVADRNLRSSPGCCTRRSVRVVTFCAYRKRARLGGYSAGYDVRGAPSPHHNCPAEHGRLSSLRCLRVRRRGNRSCRGGRTSGRGSVRLPEDVAASTCRVPGGCRADHRGGLACHSRAHGQLPAGDLRRGHRRVQARGEFIVRHRGSGRDRLLPRAIPVVAGILPPALPDRHPAHRGGRVPRTPTRPRGPSKRCAAAECGDRGVGVARGRDRCGPAPGNLARLPRGRRGDP